MTLTACYVVANEAGLIAESLRSVKAYVDRFVIVDSIFSVNPVNATHSTDDTRKVCEAICDPVPLTYIESDRKLRQEEARNLYLDAVPIGEWIVNLDGDEVLYGDHAEIREIVSWLQADVISALKVPVLSAAVLNHGLASEMSPDVYGNAPIIHTRGLAPRFFRVTPDMRYREFVTTDGIVDNQGLWQDGHLLGSIALADFRMLIVNHHVRQTWSEYQADAVWETLNSQVQPVDAMVARRVAGFVE